MIKMKSKNMPLNIDTIARPSSLKGRNRRWGFLLLLLLCGGVTASAQFSNFKLDVPQYNIILKRTIIKKSATCASADPLTAAACNYDNTTAKLNWLVFGSTTSKPIPRVIISAPLLRAIR
jgi:hypothetical protein